MNCQMWIWPSLSSWRPACQGTRTVHLSEFILNFEVFKPKL
jgi:hypothetical protein